MKNLDKIKESISIILDSGGKVSYLYKENMGDWVTNVELYYLENIYGISSHYYIYGGWNTGEYQNMEEAITKYMECVFGEKNLWPVLESLRKKLKIEDWESEGYDFENPSEEFLNLIEEQRKFI